MQKDKLRELAVVLTESMRQNASIDWTIKESVKAKLKVMLKGHYESLAIHRICRCWLPKPYLNRQK